jgi:hypothetical protein
VAAQAVSAALEELGEGVTLNALIRASLKKASG